MHFHLLKNTPLTPALPRTALTAPALPGHRTRPAAALDLRRIVAGLARRWLRNRTAATLNGMDDRMLSDIGLRRADIHSYVAAITPDTDRAAH